MNCQQAKIAMMYECYFYRIKNSKTITIVMVMLIDGKDIYVEDNIDYKRYKTTINKLYTFDRTELLKHLKSKHGYENLNITDNCVSIFQP